MEHELLESREVLLFPYLPASERLTTALWELVPRGELEQDDFSDDWLRDAIPGLLELYKTRSGDWGGVGCIARPANGQIGDPVDRQSMGVLQRGVVVSLLDGNPELPGDDNGHAVATSDNAVLFGHRVDPSGHVAVNYGVMVRAVVAGLQIGHDDVTIAPPPETHIPFMHPSVDGLYLDALLRTLTKSEDSSRRLARSIDWLDLAWRNTSSIDEDTRIVALRAGFEVLFGVGDSTSVLQDALSDLLDSDDAPKINRVWVSLAGIPRAEQMKDLQWWFLRFAFLRNAIMHGSSISDDEYMHDGARHLWLGELKLRQAIKRIVAKEGNEEILMTPLERALQSAVEEVGFPLNEQDESPS